MNFTELQCELRSISKKVDNLAAAVEQMRPKTADEKADAYKSIENLAIHYPITGRGLDTAEENTRNMYIRVLAAIALSEDAFFMERLLYIARIAAGIGTQRYSAEQMVELGSKFDASDVADMAVDLEPVKEMFLLDAFNVANICGKASEEILTLLAELAVAFGYGREDMEILAAVSKGALTDDFSSLDAIKGDITCKWCGKFLRTIPGEWLERHRYFCGRYCKENGIVWNNHSNYSMDSNVYTTWPKVCREISSHFNMIRNATPKCKLEKMVDSGMAVRKGQKLIVFMEEYPQEPSLINTKMSFCISGDTEITYSDKKSISAPEDGIVFYIEDSIKNKATDKTEQYVNVYVASRFDSYDAFCEWYNTQKKGRTENIGNISDQ